MKNQIKSIFVLILVILVSLVYKEYPSFKNFYDDNLDIYFINVGQGDAELITTSQGSVILIDGGPSNNLSYEISNLLPFWIDYINLVIVSHSHADHISGLIDMLDRYRINCILYDDTDDPISNTEKELREKIYDNPTKDSPPIVSGCLNKDDTLSVTNYANPNGADKQKNQNLESIVTLISDGSFDVLFTGDAENEEQVNIIDMINTDIEILKVPHHGASDSFYGDLIEKLKPELAVISVGKDNSYKHPNQSVLDAYEKMNIPVFRTDLKGTIHIKEKDNYWWLVN